MSQRFRPNVLVRLFTTTNYIRVKLMFGIDDSDIALWFPWSYPPAILMNRSYNWEMKNPGRASRHTHAVG